jgi:pyruvate/2-oxoglutarate dehydrogenase complex dihydrolipoamide acyltransferase (E2) component
MAGEFRLADIGEGLTEAEIVRWLVQVGDEVAVDQPVVEVETAKSVVELPSPFAGTVLHLGAPDGGVLEVGELVAVVGAAGETWSPSASDDTARPIVGSLSEDAEDLTPVAAPVQGPTSHVLAVPLVRKLAKDLGVELGGLRGSGPQGRITRADVEAAAGSVSSNGSGAAPADAERRPLSAMRRTIARSLSRAWSEIPMVSAFDEVDVSRLLSARKALAEHYGRAVPLDALLVAAVLPVLREFPEFNATLDGDTLLLHRRHDIGLAVDTPDGLMVAVIADASALTLQGLAEEVVRLGTGARARTLSAAELSGQTFTVSNIGAVGGSGHGTPLVPPGTTGILSLGRAVDKPVVRDGRIEIAPVMPVSLSYDHRVIDGGTGRRFLAMLSGLLCEPVRLLA